VIIEVKDEAALRARAEELGRLLQGGEVIELVGDVGAGKTTFVKGMARGLDIAGDIQSPTFTISRVYDARDGLRLAHYDFYRLAEAGIMREELDETIHDAQTVTAIEWGDIVEGVLPENRLTIRLEAPTETSRTLTLAGPRELLEKL
jgi:tRNA threonylcarbamoyladenosine biosynthesis protein TsaE